MVHGGDEQVVDQVLLLLCGGDVEQRVRIHGDSSEEIEPRVEKLRQLSSYLILFSIPRLNNSSSSLVASFKLLTKLAVLFSGSLATMTKVACRWDSRSC